MSSWTCNCDCPPCPAPFFGSGAIRVNDIFFALYDSSTKLWHFPAFRSTKDYNGTLTPISVPIYGQQQTFYVLPDQTGTSTRPQNAPVLVSRPCSTRCVLSSSELLEQDKEDNMLQLVQNGAIQCPMDSCTLMLYNRARDKVINNYVCTNSC